ncbi:hypothetical protein AB0K02_30255 [Streptomyces sp. NPDC049597]|uniref:hypothetical protein n=1 Tax=Streptomyces sp. NPDC049597 TaxID=3155276 RepID=UPI00342A1E22
MNRKLLAFGLVLLLIAIIGVAGIVRGNTLVDEFQSRFDHDITRAEKALQASRDAEGEQQVELLREWKSSHQWAELALADREEVEQQLLLITAGTGVALVSGSVLLLKSRRRVTAPEASSTGQDG